MELAGEYSLLEQTTAKWKKHYDAISKTEEWEALTQGNIKTTKTNSRTGNGERILKKATTIFAARK